MKHKTTIQPFKPTTQNLMLMESVLRTAVRNGFHKRNKSILPTFNAWNRDEVRDAIKAYRMFKKTEAVYAH